MTTKPLCSLFLREARGAAPRKLLLGSRIAEAGEGIVYSVVGRPDKVVKLYKEERSPVQVAKLERLIGMSVPELAKCCAWPETLVHDEAGRVVGFLMRHAEGLPIHQLYHPKDRLGYFPNATWGSLVAIALNVASAFEALHQQGVLMADVNHSNLLVSPRTGLVTLIDCDSYQVPGANGGVYRCEVGVPEWTPPELQGADLSHIVRSPENEGFGVALMLFHVLNNGWHPYQGIPKGPNSAEEPRGIMGAIRAGAFAFTLQRKVPVLPHPSCLQGEDFPKPVWDAFEAAFGLNPQHRPGAGQWRVLLSSMYAGLQQCKRNERHHFAGEVRECPWCSRRVSGMGEAWGIKRQPTLEFLLSEMECFGMLEPESIERVDVLGVFEASGIGGMQTRGGRATMFGRLCTQLRRIAEFFRGGFHDGNGLRKRWVTLVAELKGLVKNREALVGVYQLDFEKQKASSLKRLGEYLEKLKQAQISVNHIPVDPQWQKQAYLSECRLVDHDIPKLGQKRLEALLAAGIQTAADVRPERLCGIPWVGPVYQTRILQWKGRCLRDFDPKRPLGREARIQLEEHRLKVGEALQTEVELALAKMERVTWESRAAVAVLEERILQVQAELTSVREACDGVV